MGSDKDDADAARTPDDVECQPSGVEALVSTVSGKMRCSLPQARLSLDAVLESIKEAPKPLRINGFGVFEDGRIRRFKRGKL